MGEVHAQVYGRVHVAISRKAIDKITDCVTMRRTHGLIQ